MNTITFAVVGESGISNVREIKQSAIAACPYFILMADHYRQDGSCKCSNKVERAKMIKNWGYKKSHFKKIPLID
jgi:hypothetical protein